MAEVVTRVYIDFYYNGARDDDEDGDANEDDVSEDSPALVNVRRKDASHSVVAHGQQEHHRRRTK